MANVMFSNTDRSTDRTRFPQMQSRRNRWLRGEVREAETNRMSYGPELQGRSFQEGLQEDRPDRRLF